MKLAFYAFGNFRLSGIHAGIQMGHAACELFTTENQKRYSPEQKRMVQQWVDRDKVFVFLHAGQSKDILEAYNLHTEKLQFPTTLFREEPEAFGDDANTKGAVTAWGLVIPESVYAARWERPSEETLGYYRAGVQDGERIVYHHWTEGKPEFDFLKYKSQFGLAR